MEPERTFPLGALVAIRRGESDVTATLAIELGDDGLLRIPDEEYCFREGGPRLAAPLVGLHQ